ncbi:hypothetical protein KIN20_020125 [Parelaphostrongylus tenuis]|uniref:Uncharacterized protein n=1 Tax=Parelaphostrongylus tenuis TaxID=148309 RepID=A0AAD5MQM1_PARTN|nr:hypothetical protein KIN20_020125 [Parelaphostrongylus tenuis]
MTTCRTAPTATIESIDDLDTEISSMLNGNLKDDMSGSESTRSLDEGYRLLEKHCSDAGKTITTK